MPHLPRPAGKTGGRNSLVYGKCLKSQKHTFGFNMDDRPRQTPMISEIADDNGRAVMIVAKFGLSRWLDGSMVSTTFITQPDAIKKDGDSLPPY